MTSQTIKIKSPEGKYFSGYLAVPEAGKGPGLLLLQEIFGVNETMRKMADLYAAEGYLVLVPDLFWRIEPDIRLGHDPASLEKAFGYLKAFDFAKGVKDIGAALRTLRASRRCTGKVGALGFCLGGQLAYQAAAHHKLDCAVSYYGVRIEEQLGLAKKIKCPMVMHFAEKDAYVPLASVARIEKAFARRPEIEIYRYPGVDHAFANPDRPSWDRPAAMMAHTRTIALLRRALGPRYDLSKLWERHTALEFAVRDAAATMKTMVPEPYVNHVPTMTGGVGHDELHRFYRHHFIPKTPKDTKLVPISRTIGADRVVDEMLFCFTHDSEIDWMLPGVAPTGRYVEIPLVAVVNFRGDKLYHEHIYWDQASVLVQIGLLDPAGLPVAGIETARKVRDERRPSNTLMRRWAESEGKP